MSPETIPIPPAPTDSKGARPTINPDRLAELEEERRFLLRSIADLERERAAGDVDEHDYETLRDGYTARAARVLRAIDEGRSALPPKPPRSWKRRLLVIAAVVVVGAGAGILVALGSGQRDAGDVITGGTSPNQVATLLSDGRRLFLGGNVGGASERYLAVLDIDSNNVEALSYSGWLLAISSQGQVPDVQANLLEQSKQFLEEAIAIDPTYADAHCFLSGIAVVFEGDPTEGARHREDCLANNPSAEMRELVGSFVEPTSTTG